MFKDSNNTKGHGSIRKNKVYGAVGVLALGAAAIVGGTSQASADEVTEAPVNSEPVATSQANADSLLRLQMSLLQQPQQLQQTLLIHNLLKQ